MSCLEGGVSDITLVAKKKEVRCTKLEHGVKIAIGIELAKVMCSLLVLRF